MEKKWHESPRWQKVKDRIPKPIARPASKVISWLKAENGSKKASQIEPLYPRIQTYHTRQFARFPKFARACIFICAFMLWLVIFGVILSGGSLPRDIGGFGAPVRLACTAKLW